jgi:HK97 family phage prohead protease
MNKQIAYSTLEVKAFGEEGGKRTFKGIATTPTADRMGDVVEPKGAEFKLPIPLLWQHDNGQPIGWVRAARVTAGGIEVDCEMAAVDEEGTLKARLDEAWQSIKAKLVAGLSIGFKPIESARIGDTYSYRYLKWLWLELSAVTVPANGDASITAIKAIDTSTRAALGLTRKGVVYLDPAITGQPAPGASGTEGARRPGVVYLNP